MAFFTNRETLKATLLSVCDSYSNHTYMSVLNSVFRRIDLKKVQDVECRDLITMILTAYTGVERGLAKGSMVIDYALSNNSRLNDELKSRYKNEKISSAMMADLMDFYSSIDIHYDLINKGQDLVDAITDFDISGVHDGAEKARKLHKQFNSVHRMLESKVTADKGETLVIDSANNREEGLDEMIEKMDVEDRYKLTTNSIFDKTVGKYRPTKLIVRGSIAGGGKSVGLLNETLLIKDNPKNIVPQEVLNGLTPAVLYITFENSLVQTFNRVLAYYGFDEDDIAKMSHAEKKEKALTKLGHSPAGIAFVIKKLPRNTITCADLRTIFREYENKGYRIIFFANDYVDLMDVSYSDKDSANSLIPIVKKTEELKALAEDFYLPVSSAVQLNRPGEIALKEAEARMKTPDPITVLNAGYIAGGHQVKAKVDTFDFIYKSEFRGKPYMALLNDKQRDLVKKDEGFNGLYVSPMDKGGFKVMNDVVYKSASELSPEAATTADVFADLNRKRKEEQAKADAELDKEAA